MICENDFKFQRMKEMTVEHLLIFLSLALISVLTGRPYTKSQAVSTRKQAYRRLHS